MVAPIGIYEDNGADRIASLKLLSGGFALAKQIQKTANFI
jgi:hypothetical protein